MKTIGADLERAPLFRLMIRFSVPAVAAYLVYGFYTIADRMIVGLFLGPLALASVTLAFPVVICQFSLTVLISIGASSLVSLYIGERNRTHAERVMGNALTLLLAGSALMAGAGLAFLDPLLHLLGVGPESWAMAGDYLRILLAGTPLALLGFLLTSLIRAQGEPTMSMTIMVFGAILNVVLDLLFIRGMDMGTGGAALATVLAEGASAAWAFVWLHRAPGGLRIKLHHLRIHSRLASRMLVVGLAPFLMDIAACLQHGVLNRQLLDFGGPVEVAALGILFPLQSVLMDVIFGISDGIQPVFGTNCGAGHMDRLAGALRRALAGSALAVGIITAVMLMMAEVLTTWFTDDPELARRAAAVAWIFLAATPFTALAVIGALYFQATGRGATATTLGLLRQGAIMIPLLLLLPGFWGLTGVWMAVPLADLVACVPILLVLRHEVNCLEATGPALVRPPGPFPGREGKENP